MILPTYIEYIEVGIKGSFVYIAYASDGIGTGFTMTNDPDLRWTAILISPIKITVPVVTNFEGLWREDREGTNYFPDTLTPETENAQANGKHTHKLEITQAISEIVKSILDNNHESYLIENTTNVSETVASSWTVIPYNEQVGEFKAVVMIRNKATDTIITLMSLLSFDYSESPNVVLQSDLITDAALTLTVGVNIGNVLYATISGMPADAKRIHFCFERCVLSQREWLLSFDFEIGMSMEAVLSAYLNLQASNTLGMTMAAVISNYEAFTPIQFGLLYNSWAFLNTGISSDDNWVVPDYWTWDSLITYIGGSTVGGGKLKETGTTYWNTPNSGADNYFLFNGRGAGNRNNSGNFVNFRSACLIWSRSYTTPEPALGKYYVNFVSTNANIALGSNQNNTWGQTVRLVRTSTTLSNGQTGSYTGNDGKTYPTICINGKEWLARNLAETKFRDGSTIPYHGAGTDFYTDAEWLALSSAACCPPNGNWSNV